MTYQEKAIPKESLAKFLTTLDSDEGVRIDNELEHIFFNKTSKRYCIDISINNKDEFIYKNSVEEVIEFLKNHLKPESKIFTY